MKVTLCTYDGDGCFGGPFTWLRRFVPALRERGVAVRILALTLDDERRCWNVPRLRASGVPVSTLRWHSLSQLRDNTEQRVRWILAELQRDRPDVLIANMVAPAYYAARWAREAGIATIGMLQSDDAFHHALIDEFVAGRAEFRLSHVAAVSTVLYDAAARTASTTRIVHIPYFVPIPLFRARPPDGLLKLAYAGRLVQRAKRAGEVAKACCRVARAVDGTAATLYGDGPERRHIEEIIASHDAADRVRLAGVIDSAQLQARLSENHVFVMLSDYEGLPVALLEAMAVGLVPVCLRIRSGIPDVVRDGRTGLLVGDRANEFVAAVRRLKDAVYWQQLSDGARQLVEAEYSAGTVMNRWLRLFEECAADGNPARPVRIPAQLELPRVNPALAGEDVRWPGWRAFGRYQLARVVRRARLAQRATRGPHP